MDPADVDDWDAGQGDRNYLLMVAEGVTKKQIEAVLTPHFRPDGTDFCSASWSVDDSIDTDASVGFPWTVGVRGWPGPKATRYVLQRGLGVAVETEDTMPEAPEEFSALTAS